LLSCWNEVCNFFVILYPNQHLHLTLTIMSLLEKRVELGTALWLCESFFSMRILCFVEAYVLHQSTSSSCGCDLKALSVSNLSAIIRFTFSKMLILAWGFFTVIINLGLYFEGGWELLVGAWVSCKFFAWVVDYYARGRDICISNVRWIVGNVEGCLVTHGTAFWPLSCAVDAFQFVAVKRFDRADTDTRSDVQKARKSGVIPFVKIESPLIRLRPILYQWIHLR